MGLSIVTCWRVLLMRVLLMTYVGTPVLLMY